MILPVRVAVSLVSTASLVLRDQVLVKRMFMLVLAAHVASRKASVEMVDRVTASKISADGIILHGVDFSGADSGGAAKIRVVTRDGAAPGAPVVSAGRMDRRGLVRAILASAQDGRMHTWRIDAPMSLPAEVASEFALPADWLALAKWMHAFGSPRLWRTELRSRMRREPRRACDTALSTPMSPLNLRVFKQTWTFICEVLVPLSEAGIRIEPAFAGTNPDVVVCEGCPASVLHSKGWPRRGYKGGGEPPRALRSEMIDLLREAGIDIPAAMAEEAIRDEEGDLLDAILLVMPPFHTVVPEVAKVEGWVY